MQPYDPKRYAKIALGTLIALAFAIVIVTALGKPAKAETIKPYASPATQTLDAPYDAKPVWSGLYVGGNTGLVAGVNDAGAGEDGYIGGAQVGALFAGVGYDAKKWDVSGRLGFLITDHTLLYAKLSRPSLTNGMGEHAIGLGIGGGMETMIAKNWSLALEYERETYSAFPGAREHIGTLRINYHLPVLLNSLKP